MNIEYFFTLERCGVLQGEMNIEWMASKLKSFHNCEDAELTPMYNLYKCS